MRFGRAIADAHQWHNITIDFGDADMGAVKLLLHDHHVMLVTGFDSGNARFAFGALVIPGAETAAGQMWNRAVGGMAEGFNRLHADLPDASQWFNQPICAWLNGDLTCGIAVDKTYNRLVRI